jgi:hypothetical protein
VTIRVAADNLRSEAAGRLLGRLTGAAEQRFRQADGKLASDLAGK